MKIRTGSLFVACSKGFLRYMGSTYSHTIHTVTDIVSRAQVFTTRVWNDFSRRRVGLDMMCYPVQQLSNVAERDPNQNSARPLDRVPRVITTSQRLEDTIPTLEDFISSKILLSGEQMSES